MHHMESSQVYGHLLSLSNCLVCFSRCLINPSTLLSSANTCSLMTDRGIWRPISTWWINLTWFVDSSLHEWRRLSLIETCDRKTHIFTDPLTLKDSWTPLAWHVRPGTGVSPDGPDKKPKGVIWDLLMTGAWKH